MVYRALPFFVSLAGLWLMPYVAKRLFRSPWVSLLAVVAFAIHPVAIEMSVEFKHYGVEIGLYVVLFAVYLLHRRRQTTWSLALLLGMAWLAFLFAMTAVFLYPALFGLLAWEALVRRRWWRLTAVGFGCAACLATVLTVYMLLWHDMSRSRPRSHWGYFYDVFYLQGGPKTDHETRLGWTVAKYVDLATVAGDGRAKTTGDARRKWQSAVLGPQVVDGLSVAVGWVWLALHLAGICCLLLRRKLDWLLILMSPLLWVMIFNALYRWPAGAFRVNTFYIPYSIALSMCGLDWVFAWGTNARRWATRPVLARSLRMVGPVIAAFILVPALWLRMSWQAKGAKWTERGAFREVLVALAKTQPSSSRKATILLDNSSWRPWKYYLHYDDGVSKRTKRIVLKRFRPLYTWGGPRFVNRIRRLARTNKKKHREFWVMTSKPWYHDAVRDALRAHCGRVESTTIHEHLILRCVSPKG